MYSKFSYAPGAYFEGKIKYHFLTVGEQLYTATEKRSRGRLKEFILDNGKIDGSALKESWFGMEKADVFLSHSHKDIREVKAFAGWLHETFGLTSFIDSCVWGYSDDLLWEIDNQYCFRKRSGIFDYQLRNYTTSHVHTMLSSAITEMIDNTECIIFFNTPNSLILSDEIEKIDQGKKDSTNSPWIYHELSVTNMIRKTKPSRHSLMHADESYDGRMHLLYDQAPDFEYDVTKQLQQMISLNDRILSEWVDRHNRNVRGARSLDELYKIVAHK